MHNSIAKFHLSETKKSEVSTKIEEISLVQTQIEVLNERIQQCLDTNKKARYQKGLDDLEERLDNLLLPQINALLVMTKTVND